MLEKPEKIIGEIGGLNSKLMLLFCLSHSGKTCLLQIGSKITIKSLNLVP